MATAPEPMPRPQDERPPTISRTLAGSRHIVTAVGHWAGGHTIGAEELTRRIVRGRVTAHSQALTNHARLAQAAHNKVTRLKRRAAQNNGLVPADQTALAAAELEGARHDAALAALAEFDITALDPGQVRHRRHLIAAVRYVIVSMPIVGVLAASWTWNGSVVLVALSAFGTLALVRGDRPYDLTVRPVPADLIAATPLVAATDSAPPAAAAAAEPLPIATDEWRTELRRFVEYSVAVAKLGGREGVHVVDLLAALQADGRQLGQTSRSFPAVLRDAGIPTDVVKLKGSTPPSAIGVRHDKLTAALGRTPVLPAHLVPDLTADQEAVAVGE